MNRINKKIVLFCCMAGLGFGMTACSSDDDAIVGGDTGTVSLSVSTDTAFDVATRSLDESDYECLSNYTVQILNSDSTVLYTYNYESVPDTIELSSGAYIVKAYTGTEYDASRDYFYVEGYASFNVENGRSTSVSVTCTPTCGKVQAEFDDTMADYFSTYYVVYTTNALTASGTSATWQSSDTEPWYLLLDKGGEEVTATIHFTRISDGKSSSVTTTTDMDRNTSWTLSIAPEDSNGSLGISITVNEETNDEEIDVVVPSEWV